MSERWQVQMLEHHQPSCARHHGPYATWVAAGKQNYSHATTACRTWQDAWVLDHPSARGM